MGDFENTLQAASQAILKRELTENERVEFLELAGVIGMSSVEDYLYMLMIFKRNEDKVNKQLVFFENEMKARFDEISALERKIDITLKKSIEDMLGKGAEKIGYLMGRDIVDSAKEILKTSGEFHFLRGQVLIVFITVLMAALGYWLGSVGAFATKAGAFSGLF